MSEKTTSRTYVEVNKITGSTVFYNDPKWSITFKSPDSEDSEASEVFEAKFASYSGGILLLEPVTTSKKDEDVTIFRLLEQCLDEPDSNINSALWDAGPYQKRRQGPSHHVLLQQHRGLLGCQSGKHPRILLCT